MTPMLDIGEMLLSDTVSQQDYFFRPSLKNMTKVGAASEIVEIYAVLNGSELSKVLTPIINANLPASLMPNNAIRKCSEHMLAAAIRVIESCCDKPVSMLVGEFKGWQNCIVYRPGKISKEVVINVARELIEHGVIGKAKIRKLQKNEGKNDYSTEFNAMDYINSARIHFSMSRAEAEQLTMTEFQLLLKAKYPEEKGFTREEYDEIMDADDRLQERLIAEEKMRLANAW
ncbi:DUF6246 family protein [Yersinia pseudotuberculosis]|uniref:DUF6246 family protein n=1 Tax=Yersinia pseudotuberculosis TaxID=633 RepID=UPI0005E0F543|nr:DUF6246 family protein [Yersinia pseudotuberculosis]PSH36697.1 hypothetical protein BA192_02130 [Yersinia pseudotuberculosis]CND37970.1 Uncharacterised protein [Yersinia pseudotuberculosis]CQH06571.1 Uncharacterised protein [Yersinia pseudotuberculosis]